MSDTATQEKSMTEEQTVYRETPTVGKIAAALAKAQATITSPPRNREVQVFSKRTNSKYKFKYATLDSIIDHVRKPLTENGMWFAQVLEGDGQGKYRLVTRLLHESGEQIESRTPLLVDGASNQEFGSALTYMRRYALTAMLGIAADEDDDANAADGNTVEKSGALITGPHNITKLKELSKVMYNDLQACGEEGQLVAFLNSREFTEWAEQVQRDRPQWWHGEGDAAGFQTHIDKKRADIAEAEPVQQQPTQEQKIKDFLKRPILAFPDKMNDGDFCVKMQEAAHLAPDTATLDKLVAANQKRIDKLDGDNTEALRATIENAREQINQLEAAGA